MTHRISTQKILIILFWIAVWQLAGMIIQNDIIFAGPGDVIRSFFVLIPTSDFWYSIGWTFGKISFGFCLAFFFGVLLGSLAFRFHLLAEFLDPVILLMKSIPVASFVILALIWIGSGNLSVLISFLVVFPILYVNTITGLQNTDHKLLEMAEVFSIPLSGRIRCIYLPAMTPYLISGCKVALGMSWKSGIAAEVIGVPSHTIGENLYMSKIYLATSDLFAWTIVIILVSAAFESLFLKLMQAVIALIQKRGISIRPASHPTGQFRLTIRNLTKSYGTLSVWKNLNLTLETGHTYCLMGMSGSGKTTFLRILLGLEQPDSGSVRLERTDFPMTAVFQENRLCEDFSALDNVALIRPVVSRNDLYQELSRLLPEEAILRPVNTLSGGMKRRVAIVRALLAPSCAVLMDEPFTGLDEDTKQTVIDYIKEKTTGKLLVVSTHQEEDVAALNGTLLRPF